MEDRKKVSTMLHDFIQSQRDLIDQAEHRLQASVINLKKNMYTISLINICPRLN